MSETTYMFEEMPFNGNDSWGITTKCRFTGCNALVTLSKFTDEQLDSAFARKWIWPLELAQKNGSKWQSYVSRINHLKDQKAQKEKIVMEVCPLPADVTKHVLCSFF